MTRHRRPAPEAKGPPPLVNDRCFAAPWQLRGGPGRRSHAVESSSLPRHSDLSLGSAVRMRPCSSRDEQAQPRDSRAARARRPACSPCPRPGARLRALALLAPAPGRGCGANTGRLNARSRRPSPSSSRPRPWIPPLGAERCGQATTASTSTARSTMPSLVVRNLAGDGVAHFTGNVRVRRVLSAMIPRGS